MTRSSSETWTAQQLREITPFGVCATVIIRDRDGNLGGEFERVVKGVGMRVVKTPPCRNRGRSIVEMRRQQKPPSPDVIERWKPFLRDHRDAIGGWSF